MITQDRLKSILHYDQETGVFTWKHRSDVRKGWNTKWAGKAAGSPHSGGYLAIAIDRVKYLAHHLAWLYVTGEMPKGFIDHRNLDKRNNRFSNLRPATFSQNSANISVRKNSASGIRGVYFSTRRNVWCAKIRWQKKEHYLGSFAEKAQAAAAYAEAAKSLFGEFCPEYLKAA